MCCQGLGRCDLAHDVVFALASASLSLPRAGRCIRASFRATVLRHLLTSTRVRALDAGSLVPLDLQAVTLVSIMQIDHATRTV